MKSSAHARFPQSGAQTEPVHAKRQSGALAFRRHPDGGVEILLVRKPRSVNWGIPKGNAHARLSLAENATKEAFEEAGVRGAVQAHSSGTYRAFKRVSGRQVLIEVSVFLLEVTSTARKWPEQDEREIKWCSPQEAIALLREPLLIELCARLAM